MSIVLSQKTQAAMLAYKQHLARLNGVENTATRFSVVPSVEQELIPAYQAAAEFLKLINLVWVGAAMGEKLGIGSNTTIASTTDTRIQPRRPTPFGGLEPVDEYLCTKTNYDIAFMWAVIDQWSHKADFMSLLSAYAAKQVALDKQRIGFHGTHRVKTSNRELYPNLEDVNVGWLEKIRAYSPERNLKDNVDVGAAQADFKTLDGLVEMAIDAMIAEEYQEDDDLVAICGRKLLADKYLPLLNQERDPTEQIAARSIYSTKMLGTLKTIRPKFFPANTLLITSTKNLSIYMQSGSLRRLIRDEPEWDRTADYQSVNECYVVEDYKKCALIENINIVQ